MHRHNPNGKSAFILKDANGQLKKGGRSYWVKVAGEHNYISTKDIKIDTSACKGTIGQEMVDSRINIIIYKLYEQSEGKIKGFAPSDC